MQKARHYPEGLWQLVSIRFQVLFHSPLGVLFTFPSRYSSLSVIWEYLALPSGLGRFERNFTCTVLLGRESSKIIDFQIRGFHPLWPELSWSVLLTNNFLTCWKVWYLFKNFSRNPNQAKLSGMTLDWFRLFPVRSPLLWESLLFSIPAGTEMFHFPALLLTILCIQIAAHRY